MGKDKSRLESALKEGSEFVIPLLRAVQKSSDAFPPLKSAVSLALVIGETVIVGVSQYERCQCVDSWFAF